MAYFFIVATEIFLDAVKLKSRSFVIIIHIAFVAINLYNIYNNIIGVANVGVKLATYKIQNEEMTIWKRSVKRSIYIQIILFSLHAIWVMIKDKKMELMMFATANIYRTSGTSTNDVNDKMFTMGRVRGFTIKKKRKKREKGEI